MNIEKKQTILLVEDEAIISIIASRAIKRFGYNVLSVNTGERAVELTVSDSSIDMILMDIDLGDGIDGTEAARQILSFRNIPIVFHTSHSEREMVERVRGITRYGYVIKSSGDFVLQSSIEMAFELFDAKRSSEESMAAMTESKELIRLKNAELGAVNQQLVSVVEELEAANEEFEAMNEELTTSNAELQKKEQQIVNEKFFADSIIDSLPGIFYLYSYPELRLKRWNKNHETVFGYGPDDLNDRYISDWVRPEEREKFLKIIEGGVKKGFGTMEFPLLRKDGIPILFFMTGLKFESGGDIYLMGSGINIAERKKIEDAVARSDELIESR